MTTKRRSPPVWRPRRASGNGDSELCDRLPYSTSRNPLQLGPGTLAALRGIWWRQAGLGHRLPAEQGVIATNIGPHKPRLSELRRPKRRQQSSRSAFNGRACRCGFFATLENRKI